MGKNWRSICGNAREVFSMPSSIAVDCEGALSASAARRSHGTDTSSRARPNEGAEEVVEEEEEVVEEDVEEEV